MHPRNTVRSTGKEMRLSARLYSNRQRVSKVVSELAPPSAALGSDEGTVIKMRMTMTVAVKVATLECIFLWGCHDLKSLDQQTGKTRVRVSVSDP